MKNWLLVASFVLCCQFQNSTLAMMCEKIKVGFHYLNLTYSQTSYLGISWSTNLKKISILTLGWFIFKASHLWDASRIWVNLNNSTSTVPGLHVTNNYFAHKYQLNVTNANNIVSMYSTF